MSGEHAYRPHHCPTTIDPVARVARHLTAIVEMCDALEDQAVNDANDRLMPGGLAMVALGSVANIEAWSNKLDTAERLGMRPAVEDDDDWEPPLQTLLFWSEDLRRTHGLETDARPTVTSEANVIRWALEWMWENEPHFDDFARDIARARGRLETLLKEGNRAERTRVVCDQVQCEADPPRLLKVYGSSDEADRWKCPRCKTQFDADALKRAHAKQLRHEGAQRYVLLADAIGTLRAQGRSERTIRKWLGSAEVHSYCEPTTRRTLVWWPDLWLLHLTTKTRKRGAA